MAANLLRGQRKVPLTIWPSPTNLDPARLVKQHRQRSKSIGWS